MDFDEVLVKEIPGLCRCCLSDGCYKDMLTEFHFEGQKEIYADMLLECFAICINQQVEGFNSQQCHICDACIFRLRDACHFKRQVLESEKKFLDMVASGNFSPKVAGIRDMKIEPAEENEEFGPNLEGVEFGGDTDSDEPLKPPAKRLSKPKITVDALAVKRRKHKKSTCKLQKASKVAKFEAGSALTGTKDDDSARPSSGVPSKRRRQNIEILFNNTSVIPFKFRGKYLCFLCGKDIVEATELRKHTKSHGLCTIKDTGINSIRSAREEIKLDVSDITCEICNESFTNLNEIIIHLIHKHKLEYDTNVEIFLSPYRLVDLNCLICHQKFAYFKKLVNHMNENHPKNNYVCEKCSRNFSKKRDLFSHMTSYHRDGGFKCDECDSNFTTRIKLHSHKEVAHLHTCNVCFDKFTSSAKKLKHINSIHLKDGDLQCRFCLKSCNTKQAFLQHVNKCKAAKEVLERTVTNTKVVDDPEEKVSKVRLIRNNLACLFNMSTVMPFKYFMNRFRCFFCPKDFVESEDLRRHSVIEHPICDTRHSSMKLRAREDIDIKLDISSLNCKVCYEIMPDIDSLVNHLISKHKAVYDKTIDCKIIPFQLIKDNYKCPLCPEGESHRYFCNVLKHMNEAHSNHRLICVFCGKAFRTDPNLRAHISRHHKEATHKCVDCNAIYKTSLLLNNHMAKAHGKKIAKCPKCPERFTSSYQRQKHLISAHNHGATCPHCGRMFTRNSLMGDHIRRTHLKEKTFECPVCNMKFFDNFMLRMHMVRHGGERNFHCDICGKKFLWKKNLRNHMSIHEKHSSGIGEIEHNGV